MNSHALLARFPSSDQVPYCRRIFTRDLELVILAKAILQCHDRAERKILKCIRLLQAFGDFHTGNIERTRAEDKKRGNESAKRRSEQTLV